MKDNIFDKKNVDRDFEFDDRVADVFDDMLERSVRYLKKWQLLERIDAVAQETPAGVIVTFTLKDATIVAQIDVTGNYPYIENKVRKYLTLNAGDIYTPERVDEQVERLAEFYKREGYVDTDFSVTEDFRPAGPGSSG